jgi:hypothetical protein
MRDTAVTLSCAAFTFEVASATLTPFKIISSAAPITAPVAISMLR